MGNYNFTEYAGANPLEKMGKDFSEIYSYLYENGNEKPSFVDIYDYLFKKYTYEIHMLTAARRDCVVSDRECIAGVITLWLYFKDIQKDIAEINEEYPGIDAMDYILEVLAGAKIKNTKDDNKRVA